ncbi:MAG: PP2C family protein-serine/threonine phosphatase, partial [Pirellulaceae bacterium]
MSERREETQVDVQSNFSRDFFAEPGPRWHVQFAGSSHPGKRRERNEDHYAVFRRKRSCEMVCTNLPPQDMDSCEESAWSVLVADGIGGASFGDYASQLALESILHASADATSWLMKLRDVDAQEVERRATAYVDRIQEAFRQHGCDHPEKKHMGTTLTAAYLLPPHVIVAHIGDSRAYLYDSEGLHQITRDQTLAQALIDEGVTDTKVRKFSHILMNSLGGDRGLIQPEVTPLTMQSGDRLLVCTDGLSDMVDDERIAEAMQIEDVSDACQELVDLALEAGGKDNITV